MILITEDKESVLRNYLKIVKDWFIKMVSEVVWDNLSDHQEIYDEKILQHMEDNKYELTV